MQPGLGGSGRMGMPLAQHTATAGLLLTGRNRTDNIAQALAADIGCTVAQMPCPFDASCGLFGLHNRIRLQTSLAN